MTSSRYAAESQVDPSWQVIDCDSVVMKSRVIGVDDCLMFMQPLGSTRASTLSAKVVPRGVGYKPIKVVSG